MSRVIAFVDLDDTLFQTLRKCPPEMDMGRLTPLAFDKAGEALSFATPRQVRFLDWLVETAELVPVTARSADALGRARIPHRLAVCAHGGVILRDEKRDAGWAARMAAAAADHRAELDRLAAELETLARGCAIRSRILAEGGLPLYLLAKHEAADAAVLGVVADRLSKAVPRGWTLHRNGNNAAWLPPFLGKAHAVRHLLDEIRRETPHAVAIGVGDSLTDAPFMELCDFAMLPTRSQLAERLFDAR